MLHNVENELYALMFLQTFLAGFFFKDPECSRIMFFKKHSKVFAYNHECLLETLLEHNVTTCFS